MPERSDLAIVRELKNRTGDDFLLYQPSCNYHESFQASPHDAVILCSKDFARSERIGKVYCVKSDNNVFLSALLECDVKIRSAVFIRDGCREGGNYECTNTATYLGRLLPILHDHFLVLTDHGTETGFFDIPVNAGMIDLDAYCSAFIKQSDPIGKCMFWEVEKIHESLEKIQIGKIGLSIIHDSIFGCLDKLDLIVIHSRKPYGFINYFGLGRATNRNDSEQFLDRYFPFHLRGKTGLVKFAWQRLRSLKELIEFAVQNGLHQVGLTPFGNGRYNKIWEELHYLGEELQSEISLFHLNRDDYSTLYSRCG